MGQSSKGKMKINVAFNSKEVNLHLLELNLSQHEEETGQGEKRTK